VVGGVPVELDAHLERLRRSLRALYLLELPADLDEQLRTAAELELGRLRLTATPPSAFGGNLGELVAQLDVEAEQIDPGLVFPGQGARLRSHPVAGGLGACKWADRPGLERPTPDQSGVLIVDRGEALEAGWANLFAVRDGALFTPPLDGRLLPGTARAAVLELAAQEGIEAHEERLAPDDLIAAEEAFLTNSIRGIEPAEELDAQPLSGCGPVSRRLAAALRRRWKLPADSGAPAGPAAAPTNDQPAR
jgi:para-aminobenzoate synthetase/4-amino-4-deoxychorismate lyase